MIRILDSNYELQAILHEVFDARLSEGVNREYEVSFSISRDDPKAEFIGLDSIVEINGDYFYISKYSKRISPSADFIDVECEHISYLLNEEPVEFFGMTGNPSAILSSILDGTILEVGTVEFSGEILFAIEEETTKRQLLILFAETLGGELEYDGLAINIIERRGVDDGKQFRVGKNIAGVSYEVDRDKVAVGVDVIELQDKDLESIKIGDTRRVIIPHLGIDEDTRVKRYEYNPIKRKNSNVELTNFIDDLSDDLISIRSGSVQKDRLYNGIRVGPEVGFLAQRSDDLVRTQMNATEGFRIQSRQDSDDPWEDRFFVDIDGQLVLNTQQIDGLQSSINVLSDQITLEVENLEEQIGSQIEILEDQINLRVTSEDFNTEIGILEDAINLRVTSDEFNTEIGVLEDAINARVTTDDFNTEINILEGQINARVTSDEFNTEINILENAINARVTSSEFNTEIGLLEDAINLRVTSADFNSEIEILEGEISSKVTSSEAESIFTQLADSFTFSADQINFEGTANFTLGDGPNGRTRVDGGRIATGSLFFDSTLGDAGGARSDELKLDLDNATGWQLFWAGQIILTDSNWDDFISLPTSTNNAGSHNHGGDTGNAGGHNHGITPGWQIRVRNPDTGNETWQTYSAASAHSHSISNDGNHSHDI